MEIFPEEPEKNGKKKIVVIFFVTMSRDFCDGGIDRSTDSICAQYDLAGGRAGQERRARRDEPCTTLPALTGTGDGRVLATGSAVLDPDP